MCCWCCGRRDARIALPQRRRALSASTPSRSASATRFHSFGSRKVEAEEVRSSPAGERRPAKGRCTTTGNPSSLPTDTSAEPYSTCATERATQRSPLGTQRGALPYVGPESRPAAASTRRKRPWPSDHRGCKRYQSRGVMGALDSFDGRSDSGGGCRARGLQASAAHRVESVFLL